MPPVLPSQARQIEDSIGRLEIMAQDRHDSSLHEGKSEGDPGYCPGCTAMNALRSAVNYSMVIDRNKAVGWLLGIRDFDQLPPNANAHLTAFQNATPGSAGLIVQLKARLGL